MLLSSKKQVLASSDRNGMLTKTYDLRHDGHERGYYRTAGRIVAFARTPGYETYKGLGWWGCIEQLRKLDGE